MDFKNVEITWLGHATFLFEYKGKTLLVDPWLAGNPSCPEDFHELAPDAVLITHGHGDHIGNVFELAERSEGPIVGMFDLTTWLGMKGVDESRLMGMNKGGTITLEGFGVDVTMTDARHSSSFVDGDEIVYLGEAAGYVLHFDSGLAVYLAGDTCLFGDMEWIGRLWEPDVAILPIGDHFTMDPKQAAYAAQLVGAKAVIPAHYDTFPLLTGTPEQLSTWTQKIGAEVEIVHGSPGEKLG